VKGIPTIGDFFVGAYAFPPASRMTADMEEERERISRRFVRSERHTMEVDFDLYLRELEQERRRGRVRAHSVGNVRARGRLKTFQCR
jgi:hypothetical protein